MNEVTRILDAVSEGDPRAVGRLLPLVYDELRSLAAQRLLQEKPGQTLQATALVHEAYLRLVGPNDGHDWNSRGHFFAAAAEAMRRILVEQARRKQRVRHGGGRHRLSLDQLDLADEQAANDFLDLDEALHPPCQRRFLRGRRGPVALLHRANQRADGESPGHLAPHRESPLGLRSRLFVSATERRPE